MTERSPNADRFMYLLIGAGVGAALALLFAPKSGSDLRHSIADASRKGVQKGNDAAHAIGDRVAERVEGIREGVENRKASLAGALEAGKTAYREERARGGA